MNDGDLVIEMTWGERRGEEVTEVTLRSRNPIPQDRVGDVVTHMIAAAKATFFHHQQGADTDD